MLDMAISVTSSFVRRVRGVTSLNVGKDVREVYSSILMKVGKRVKDVSQLVDWQLLSRIVSCIASPIHKVSCGVESSVLRYSGRDYGRG